MKVVGERATGADLSGPKAPQHFKGRSGFGTYRMIEIHVGSLNHGVLIDNKAGGHGQGPAVIIKTSPSFVVISRSAYILASKLKFIK